MKKETRTIVYDEDLGIEAYHLEGIVQPFPIHFHEFYVIGLMQGGQRWMSCRNQEYTLKKGDMILFHPEENHGCAQSGTEPLNYIAINIPVARMQALSEEITGSCETVSFSKNVIQDQEAAVYMAKLHMMVMSGSTEFDKEESLLLLLTVLMRKYGQPFEMNQLEYRSEVNEACNYMEKHLSERICLDQICKEVNLSKSALLRAFTRYKGVTPYRYLESLRINEARKLLEHGVLPVDAAIKTGFSDQSHFTNYFTSFTGLAPGVYREIFRSKIELK